MPDQDFELLAHFVGYKPLPGPVRMVRLPDKREVSWDPWRFIEDAFEVQAAMEERGLWWEYVAALGREAQCLYFVQFSQQLWRLATATAEQRANAGLAVAREWANETVPGGSRQKG